MEHAGGISGADEIEELTPYAEEAVRLAGAGAARVRCPGPGLKWIEHGPKREF